MGFAGRVHRMVWPKEHEYEGMVVVIRAANVDTVNEMAEGRRDGETRDEATVRRLTRLVEHVESWSLVRPGSQRPETPEGEPLPKTVAALRGFDAGAIGEIIEAWSDGGRVPNPSQAEDPQNGTEREPLDPLAVSSDGGLPTGASSEVEALIPTQAIP